MGQLATVYKSCRVGSQKVGLLLAIYAESYHHGRSQKHNKHSLDSDQGLPDHEQDCQSVHAF